MSRRRATLYTAEQAEMLLKAWDCSGEGLPKPGKVLLVCFPRTQPFDVDLVEVERTDLKSDYGKRLYRMTLSSEAGRAFDDCVQEAHVLAYREYFAQCMREARKAQLQALDLLLA